MTRPGRRREAQPRRIQPLVDFLHTEAAGGVALVAATIVALVWANSPWRASYHDLWSQELVVGVGDHVLRLDLQEWVNDGLMTLFFFVVGLEIKRELVDGELRGVRRAALPAIGAMGGMVVPALVYVALNAGGAGARGWGIPMATDIAMAVGVVALLGSRVAASGRLFLLALAIVDDIGAILVIAFVYSSSLDGVALAVALGLGALVVLMRLVGLRPMLAYVLVGTAMWVALHESGVHSTLVGVALGLLAPTRPRAPTSVVERLEHVLHPWTSFVVLPLFALANAGIPIGASALSDAAGSRIAWGVLAGLVIGKPVGILGFAWVAHRLRIGILPEGATMRSLTGAAVLGGIGFTVSIFVTGLAFDSLRLQDEAKVAILAASLAAATLGTVLTVVVAPRMRNVARR